MMVARIVGVQKAGEPENLDVMFSTRTLELGQSVEPKDEIYSVREKVIEDLQKLAAWDTTRARAEEFVVLASQEDWDPAIAKFNELYGKQAKQDPNDPNVFKLDYLAGVQRVSLAQVQTIAAETHGVAARAAILRRVQIQRQLVDRLYSLVPVDTESAPRMPQILEFKASQSFYVLKNVSVRRLDRQQYEKAKGRLLMRADNIQTQSVAAAHFNPANILKRMYFRSAEGVPPSRSESSSISDRQQPHR